MPRQPFNQRLAFGKGYEKLVADWLRKSGNTLLPACDFLSADGGPKISNDKRSTIAPDLLLWKGKDAMWVEVKAKHSFTWRRNGGYWETGIDWKYYEEYKSTHSNSPWPVYLMFLQLGEPRPDDGGRLQPSGLYYNSLAVLEETKRPNKPMVYWGIHHLIKLAELHEVVPEYGTLTP